MENKERSLLMQFPALKLHCFLHKMLWSLCRANVSEGSQNAGMAWLGRDLEGWLVPIPCHGPCPPCRLQILRQPHLEPSGMLWRGWWEVPALSLAVDLLILEFHVRNGFSPQAVLAGTSLEGWRCTLHIREMFAQLSSV